MSELPENWEETSFGEVVRSVAINDKKLPRKQYKTSGKFPVVDQGQDFIGGYSDDANRVVDEDLPLIIFGDHTRIFKFLNRPFVPGADGVKVLKPLGVDEKWLYHIAHALEFPDKGYARHFQHLKKARLLVPPLPEQRRIVNRIEELFSRLDAGVAALRHAKAQLQRYRQSVLTAAVTGQLTQAWREQHPDTEPAGELLERILKQRREQWSGRGKYTEPILDLPGSLPTLPASWIWSTSGYLFDCIVPNRDKPKSFTGATPWITLPDFEGPIVIDHAVDRVGLTSAEIQSSRARVVPAGSVIMSCIGRFGLSAVLGKDAVINQQLHAFLVPESLPARYFAYCLKAQKAFMESIATSTTIAYLNKSNCNRVPIALPPLEEQHQIVAEVEARTTAIDHLEAEINRQITRSNRLRQSTLASAFSGRLVGHHHDDHHQEQHQKAYA